MIGSLILFFVCLLGFFLFVCVWMLLLLTAADGQVNSCVRDYQIYTGSATAA